MKLIINPKSLSSLKCILVGELTRVIDRLKIINHEEQNFLPLLELNDNHKIYDPIAICIYFMEISELKFNIDESKVRCEILQWLNYSSNHIRNFHVITKKNQELLNSLKHLNDFVQDKEYFVGNQFGIVDIFIVIDLVPLYKRFIKGNSSLNHLDNWFNTMGKKEFLKKTIDIFCFEHDINKMHESKKVTKVSRESDKKVRILCLHGYRQNAATFKEKLGAFRKIVAKKAELVFVTAPHKVISCQEDEEDVYGWWFNNKQMGFDAHHTADIDTGFQKTLDFIKDTWTHQGPFDGVFAFSQGAALLLIMCLLKKQIKLDFKFAIMVAPFKSKVNQHQSWYENNIIEDIKTLIVIGDNDKVIEKEMSDDILPLCTNPEILRHQGGHFVPTSGAYKKVYLEFLNQF